MSGTSASSTLTFQEITTRLDEIVHEVRDKQSSLEHSLDLFDEAIALGSQAIALVDSPEFSEEELNHISEVSAQQSSEPHSDTAVSEDVSPEPSGQ